MGLVAAAPVGVGLDVQDGPAGHRGLGRGGGPVGIGAGQRGLVHATVAFRRGRAVRRRLVSSAEALETVIAVARAAAARAAAPPAATPIFLVRFVVGPFLWGLAAMPRPSWQCLPAG